MTKKVNLEVAHEAAIFGGRYKVESNEPVLIFLAKPGKIPRFTVSGLPYSDAATVSTKSAKTDSNVC